MGASHILHFSWCWMKCRYFVSEVLILKLVFCLQSLLQVAWNTQRPHTVTSLSGNTLIHRNTILGKHWIFAAFYLSIGSMSWWWRNNILPKHVVVWPTHPYSCAWSRKMSVNLHCTSSIWVNLRHMNYLCASLSMVLYQLQSLQSSVVPSVALPHGRTPKKFASSVNLSVHKLLQHAHSSCLCAQ